MRKILTLTMSGLVTVLPLALTVYVIWWLVNTVEGWLRHALIALGIPFSPYRQRAAPQAAGRPEPKAFADG